MTVAALDRFRDAFAALRAALDGDDMAAIDAATAQVRNATTQIRAVGAWRDEPAVRERLTGLLPMIEAARIRAHMASDQTRQRLSLLADRGVPTARNTYSR